MAYMSQAKKAELAPAIKAICKKYGIKASLAVRHHSGLVLNIKEGPIDFIGNSDNGHEQVNPYHYEKHYDSVALAFLEEVIPAMMIGNHNNSDIMSDYFDVGWYIYVNIGQWDKPYKVVA